MPGSVEMPDLTDPGSTLPGDDGGAPPVGDDGGVLPMPDLTDPPALPDLTAPPALPDGGTASVDATIVVTPGDDGGTTPTDDAAVTTPADLALAPQPDLLLPDMTVMHDLNLKLAGQGEGSIVATIPGTSGPITLGTCTSMSCPTISVPDGKVLTLTAMADGASIFNGWGTEPACAATGYGPVCTFTITADASIIPGFAPGANLNVTTSGNGAGTVSLQGSGPSAVCSGIVCRRYIRGTVVAITPVANTGSAFWGFTPGCGSPCTVTLNQDTTLDARFYKLTPLTLSLSGGGNGTLSGTFTQVDGTPVPLSCASGSCQFANVPDGSTVSLTAKTVGNDFFIGWGGACSSFGSNATCTVAVSGFGATISAIFLPARTLTITASGDGAGLVDFSSSSQSKPCGASCRMYPQGASVTLTVTPDGNSVFGGWSGGSCSGSNPQCTLVIGADTAVDAKFLKLYTLGVATASQGTTTGAVVRTSGGSTGIDCGGACSQRYPSGTSVQLTASAGASTQFVSWSGASDCAGSTNPICTVAMGADKAVTANFIQTFDLTVRGAGISGDAINLNPPGSDCTSTGCTGPYRLGTVVTLTAKPGTKRAFATWSNSSGVGQPCQSNPTPSQCVVTMSQARDITAEFRPLFTVTVAKAGIGNGVVTSTPAGIDCNGTCAVSFISGSNITLISTVDANTASVTWTGCNSMSGNTCTITGLAADRTVTATYKPLYTVAVAKGTGIGCVSGGATISSTPTAISCPGTCSAKFVVGSTVTIDATYDAGGYDFEWTKGPCIGSTSGTCSFVLTANTTLNYCLYSTF